MSISLVRGLNHMAWANQEVLKSVAKLPDASLNSYLTNPEWTVAKIISHICSAASWYVHRLEKGELVGIPALNKSSDVLVLAQLQNNLDRKLIEASSAEDRELTYVYQKTGERVTRWYSTILAQSVHHATEHRAQLVDALEFNGYQIIDLDELDLWAFDIYERNQKSKA